jgi:chromate transport protein ChrA
MNPVQALLKSRKFLVLALDTVISLVLYFVTKYAAPSAVEDVKTVILALQPVVLVLIGAIAYEDGQAMKAKASKPQA